MRKTRGYWIDKTWRTMENLARSQPAEFRVIARDISQILGVANRTHAVCRALAKGELAAAIGLELVSTDFQEGNERAERFFIFKKSQGAQ